MDTILGFLLAGMIVVGFEMKSDDNHREDLNVGTLDPNKASSGLKIRQYFLTDPDSTSTSVVLRSVPPSTTRHRPYPRFPSVIVHSPSTSTTRRPGSPSVIVHPTSTARRPESPSVIVCAISVWRPEINS